MKTAEAQIWDRAHQLERDRVAALHEKMSKEGKVSKAVYNPDRVLKPWTWGSDASHSLHDIDPDLVFSVRDFDFDLREVEFINFLKDRSHIHLCRSPGSAYWLALNDHSLSRDDFISHGEFKFAQEFNKRRYQYTPDEMTIHWKIFYFTKVFLQGAYDTMQGRTDFVK